MGIIVRDLYRKKRGACGSSPAQGDNVKKKKKKKKDQVLESEKKKKKKKKKK